MMDTIKSTVTFPYKRSLGPVLGAFFTALTEQRLLGIRRGNGVLFPPLEWDPETGAELEPDFVEVGPVGTVEWWCWVAEPTAQHPLDHPFAFATIMLDGADTTLVHAVDAGSIDAMATGMRVAPRWQQKRIGHITDIAAFVPGEQPERADSATAIEPITMMDYSASITYTLPRPRNAVRAENANEQGRFLGLQCPTCGRTYAGGRGYCPVDSIELTEEHEVDLPQTGVVTNYTIITPTPYPGQTETEPFARVHVLLDGMDVVLTFQQLIEVPNEQVRVGLRVAAVWASPGERIDRPSAGGNLVGWMPTGEPDVDDPELVNRIN